MHRTEGTNFTKDSVGRNIFKDAPPATTVEENWLNAVQEEIANVIEFAGINLLSAQTDTHTQLREAILQAAGSFEYIVGSQASFNALIERTAANQYRIKDEFTSVYIKYISGGYACYGAGSFLSGGDAWGYISTNNCKLLMLEGGAYLQFGDTPGYLNINTADCILNNPDVRGLAVGAAAVNYSYYINNTGIKILNPKTSARKSNTNYCAFYSNVATNTNYICNPVINDIDTNGGTLKAFYQCFMIDNPYITNFDSSSGITTLFDACKRIVNYIIFDITNSAEHIYCFKDCYNVDSGEVNTVTHNGAVASKNVYVFHTVIGLDDRNLYITGISTNGAGGIASTFYNCTYRSRMQKKILTKTADFTITDNDDFDVLVCNPNTADQFGLLTITLPVIANSIGKNFTINFGNAGNANGGLIKIYCSGGTSDLNCDGDLIPFIYLFSKGNTATIYNNGVSWIIEKCKIKIKSNFISNSVWAARSLGICKLNYKTKSANNPLLVGTTVVETGGNVNKMVIIYDSAPAGASGYVYGYNVVATTVANQGVFTNNNVLTFSNGITANVDQAAGTNKNIDSLVYHGMGLPMHKFKFKIFINLTAATDNASYLTYPHFSVTVELMFSFYQIDTNTFKVVTGNGGMQKLCSAGGGSTDVINALDVWFQTTAELTI
jgi:hypothetical protein